MIHSSLILIFCLIACSTCSPISSWSIRINESDGYQNCMAKTRTHIFFGTRICQAEFSCNPMNYGQHGIGFAISEKLAIEEAINDSRSRCVKSSGCIRYQIVDKIERKLSLIS